MRRVALRSFIGMVGSIGFEQRPIPVSQTYRFVPFEGSASVRASNAARSCRAYPQTRRSEHGKGGLQSLPFAIECPCHQLGLITVGHVTEPKDKHTRMTCAANEHELAEIQIVRDEQRSLLNGEHEHLLVRHGRCEVADEGDVVPPRSQAFDDKTMEVLVDENDHLAAAVTTLSARSASIAY